MASTTDNTHKAHKAEMANEAMAWLVAAARFERFMDGLRRNGADRSSPDTSDISTPAAQGGHDGVRGDRPAA